MAAGGEVFSPGEAAKSLGVAASTLRIYSVKLADALSDAAGRPSPGPDGRPGVRAYSRDDVRALAKAKELLGRGLTYEQALMEIRPRPAARREGEEGKVRRTRMVASSDFHAVLEPMRGAVERAMAATEAWQRLALEREHEAVTLREEIRRLRGELEQCQKKRSWWSRLLGSG